MFGPRQTFRDCPGCVPGSLQVAGVGLECVEGQWLASLGEVTEESTGVLAIAVANGQKSLAQLLLVGSGGGERVLEISHLLALDSGAVHGAGVSKYHIARERRSRAILARLSREDEDRLDHLSVETQEPDDGHG